MSPAATGSGDEELHDSHTITTLTVMKSVSEGELQGVQEAHGKNLPLLGPGTAATIATSEVSVLLRLNRS